MKSKQIKKIKKAGKNVNKAEKIKNKAIITVKNAENDPDTVAQIVVQNKINYEPKVSVIIPVYNVEDYLRECLDSVVNQTLKEIEIICVDDGSTDKSLDILLEYAKKDNRITVLKQENLHAGVARNAGLAVARGEYLSFLDSDDFFELNMHEEMYKKAKEDDADFCICHVKIQNMLKKSIENCGWGLKDEYLSAKNPFSASEIYEKIFQFNQGWVWDKIYKKKFVDKNNIKFQSLRTANDVYFSFCNLVMAKTISICSEKFVIHRLHVSGSLENTRERSYSNIYKAVCSIRTFLENKNIYEKVKISFVNYAIANILWNYNTLQEPSKTFVLSIMHEFYEQLFYSIDKSSFYSKDCYESFEHILKLNYMDNPCDYVPIVFATNDQYSVPCAVAIASLIKNLDNTKKCAVFIMYTELKKEHISLLESLNCANVFVKTIKVNVVNLVGSSFSYTTAHYSKEMYFRILIPELFYLYPKVIYLDCDIVLKRNILELYDIDMGDNVIGAVINPIHSSRDYVRNTLNLDHEKYFNSGVLLINIRKFTECKIKEKCIKVLNTYPKLRFPDQDALNVACCNRVFLLPINWNYQWFFKVKNMNLPNYCSEEYKHAENDIYILHYSSNEKPWNNKNAVYSSLWWQYAFMLKNFSYKDYIMEWYQKNTGKCLNLFFPQTFNEKIQWMKLYDSTPIKTRLADKYLVRDWVKEKIGEEYLIPLLGVYDKFEDINFDKLPNQFVIKCNHGCGYNIIVKDKSKLDLVDTKAKLDRWMSENFAFKAGLELHYRDIKPKIIIEKYIENKGTNDLYDYKFWCFDGKVKYIQFLSERNLGGLKMAFYDRNWVKQNFVYSHPLDKKTIEKPSNLKLMIQLAEVLSKGFNHVRVDFYRLNDGKIYFGEMTFTSASGACIWNDERINQYFGSLIKLPRLAYNIDTGEYYELPKIKQKSELWKNLKAYLLFPYYLLAVPFLRKKKARLLAEQELAKRPKQKVDKNRISIKLLKCLPVFTYKYSGGKKVWKFFGLPLFKKRTTDGGKNIKFYVFGVNVMQYSKKTTKVLR